MGIDLEGWCVSSSERMMRYQHSVRSWLGMLWCSRFWQDQCHRLRRILRTVQKKELQLQVESPKLCLLAPNPFMTKTSLLCQKSLTRFKISCWTQTACMKQSTPHCSAKKSAQRMRRAAPTALAPREMTNSLVPSV